MNLSDKKEFDYEFEIRNIGGSNVYYRRKIGDKLWSFSNKEEFELNKGIMNNEYTQSDVERGTNMELEEHKKTLSKSTKDGLDLKDVARDIATDHLKENPKAYPNEDVISMNVPLFIRMLELAREDIKSDADLHKVVEKVIIASKKEGYLTMADYDGFLENRIKENSFAKGGKVNFDVEEDEDRITISLNGIGEVILVQTFPEYEFIEDIDEDTLEELSVSEGDIIGKIEHLEVNDNFKGKGYAKLLMNKAIEIAEQYGWMPLYLNASPMGSKKYGLGIEDLTGFYESLGFKVFLNQGGNNLMMLNKKENSFAKGGSVMLAPNGEPSNLTPKQWKLVRTPEFKAWFGDWENDPANASKVVDENGEPMICYHATDNKFWEFKKEKQVVGYYGKGFYFSNNLEHAKQYGKRVIPAFLNIKSVFELSDETPQELLNQLAEANVDVVDMGEENDIEQRSKYTFGYASENSDIFMNNLIKNGYYGIRMIYNLESSNYFYIVFEPNQIKLADGTNTTFDSNNPDIRFEDGGKIKLNSNKGKVNLKLSSYEDVTELVPVSELLKFREFNRFERPKYSLEDSKDNISKLEKALVENGVEEPLIIEYSLEDNSVLLIEGNHRLNVAENLGFDYLPARVVLRRREFTPLQKTKSFKVKGFTPDRYGYVPSDLKPSQVGIAGTIKAFEEGGIIEGQLHSECNEETGCGEKFDVGGVGHIIEAERDEAVIVSKAFEDNKEYEIKGTPSEIASALNVLGDGKNFDSGAEIKSEDGKKVEVSQIKKEAKNTDVESIDPNSIIINRRSMYDKQEYVAKGTPKQIASQINNLNDNGVKIVDGGSIKEA